MVWSATGGNMQWLGGNLRTIAPAEDTDLVNKAWMDAGGGGDIWVEKAGDTMTGKLNITIDSVNIADHLVITDTEDHAGISIFGAGTNTARLALGTDATIKSVVLYDGFGDALIMGDSGGNAQMKITNGVGGAFILNENGNDIDFRVESDNDTHAFSLQGSDGFIGLGTDSAQQKLQINGVVQVFKQSGQVGDPSSEVGDGAAFSMNTNNNPFAMGIGNIDGSKFPMWFQTGPFNGGGFEWWIGTDEVMRIDQNSNLVTTAGRIKTITRVTGTYTILVTDDRIFANTDSAGYTATLPAGADGQTFRIVNTGSSSKNLTIAPNGSEHLLGVNSNFTLFDGEALELSYDATDGWY